MSDTEMVSDSIEKPSRAASPAKRSAGEMESDVQHSIEIAETQETPEHGVASSIEDESYADTAATSVLQTSPALSAKEEQSTVPQLVPSIDEQEAQVRGLHARPLEEGSRGVVFPMAWLARVLSRTTEGLENRDYPKEAREGHIGKFDTSSIVPDGGFNEPVLVDETKTAFIPMKAGLRMESEIEVLPYNAYGLIAGWYGAVSGQKPVIRYAHDAVGDGSSSNIMYELYPPVFTIRTSTISKLAAEDHDKQRSATIALKMKQARRGVGQMTPEDAVQLVSSRTERFQKFLTRAKEHAGIPITTKVKIYRVKAPQGTARSKLIVDKQELDMLEEQSQLEDVAVNDETANDKYNGRSTMSMYNLVEDAILILVEQTDTRKTVTVKRSEIRQASPATGIITRGRAARTGRTRGITGLNNLGNTCYMNSALQCIRSVEELTAYFLCGQYKQEINTNNPLGHKGAMATKYDSVLKGVYNEGSSGSFSPSGFKSTLSRCAPTFAGWGQQDSQEFLSFLVDALHEDLNRIEKKPYSESPDSDDAKVQDPEYIKALGEVYRKNYKARNDSVIMDLFSGFYKNTMECPVCDKVSVTFDPYSLLTLQLPMINTVTHQFIFVPLQGRSVKHEIDVEKSMTIRGLKQYIASQHDGVNAEKLWMVEVYSHKVYRVFGDDTTIGDAGIQANDLNYLYELELVPTYPVAVQRGYTSRREPVPSMESKQAEVLTVPIFFRKSKGSSFTLALNPQYISLTREESKDLELIKNKVLQSVAQLTDQDISTDSPSPETVEEPHVSDHSGEEDYVKVSLEKPSAPASDAKSMLYRLNFAKSNDGGHCASMTSFSENTVRPLESRVKLPSRRSSIASSATEISTMQEDGEESSIEDSPEPVEEVTSPAPETAEETNAQPHDRRAGKGNKFKSGKKNNKEKRQQKREQKALRQAKQIVTPPAEETEDQPYFVQVGECLVVDWFSEPYDKLFGGGHYTGEIVNMEFIEDAAAAASRARREHRKKFGISLEDCFNETGKREQLSKDNAWFCGRCKEHREATKTLEIWTLPDILVLHLKRFGGNRRFNDKLDLKVDYPIEGLDLNAKVGLKDGKNYTYDLFAVDLHYGGLGGGHYVADAKSFVDGKWYHYNDSSATVQRETPGPQAAAYLLFYRRRSEEPLGPKLVQETVYKFRNPGELDESGEEQLDGHSSTLLGSSSSSAGITARTDNLGRIANADGSTGAVVTSPKTNKQAMMNDNDDDEGIEMDDNDDEQGPPAYTMVNPSQLYSSAAPAWGFDNLEELVEKDDDSTKADSGGEHEDWNDPVTSFEIGDSQQYTDEGVHDLGA